MTIPSIWLPSSRQTTTPARRSLIYFIPGNPGLVEYYREYLTCLRGLLDERDRESKRGTAAPGGSGAAAAAAAGVDPMVYDVYGRNLPGFEDGESGAGTLVLEDVIEGVWEDVKRVVAAGNGVGEGAFGVDQVGARTDAERATEERYGEIILMGHSVGTFIAVEIYARAARSRRGYGAGRLDSEPGSTSGNSERKSVEDGGGVHLGRKVLLFPTVTHLARSPNGRIFTAAMRTVPFLPAYGYLLARLLLFAVPLAGLRWFVGRCMGFTRPTAEVTARWVKSRVGVRQTLTLARDEMVRIAEEEWVDEDGVWRARDVITDDDDDDGGGGGGGDQHDDIEMKTGNGQRERVFMYYGGEDRWVGIKEREEFIQRRKKDTDGGEGVKIMVDERGLSHAFCTREGEYPAPFGIA